MHFDSNIVMNKWKSLFEEITKDFTYTPLQANKITTQARSIGSLNSSIEQVGTNKDLGDNTRICIPVFSPIVN